MPPGPTARSTILITTLQIYEMTLIYLLQRKQRNGKKTLGNLYDIVG
jgi:hypothetical protein